MLLFFTFLLGLFPAMFLMILQTIAFVMLVWLIWNFRRVTRAHWTGLLTWPHLALWQFLAFFLLNAALFKPLAGTPLHFRPVSLESWSGTLASSIIVMLFLSLQNVERLKSALIKGLPLGLCTTFLVATAVYISGAQGARIQLLTPNPLAPPLWFLVITMASFSWFPSMTINHKAIRILLFMMAGLMAIYSGARLVMAAWMICGVLLSGYFYAFTSSRKRGLAFISALSVPVVGLFLIVTADYLSGGLLLARFETFVDGSINSDTLATHFPRLIIWTAALAVIQDTLPWGVGQINERIFIQTEIGWERWFRAHQTYLSYLIAGGVPALISGLIFQLPTLILMKRIHLRNTFPAFIGLGIVLTLNCLTDSIFQSAVAVQAYVIFLLIFLRATANDDPSHSIAHKA